MNCSKKAWFVPGEDTTGHRFVKEVVCGKEWCPVCGADGSTAHNRRFARWLPKIQQMKTIGYFVFTIPEELRAKYRTKKALGQLGHDTQELLKSYGYRRGLRRYHWFGDKSTKWHPHLNIMVDGGFISPQELEVIKTAYANILGVNMADVNYHYRTTPGQMVHTLKYVTRATFKNCEWDGEMTMELYNFRNNVAWGKWDDSPAWSLEDLHGKARKDVAGLDVHAIESLGSGVCPECGEPIKWGHAMPMGLLDMVEKQSLGAGYWRILPDIPPPTKK
jgi:rRNA maturation protein Nop10